MKLKIYAPYLFVLCLFIQPGFSNTTTFDERKTAWLEHDGKDGYLTKDGNYITKGGSNGNTVEMGKRYLFAWLENGTHFTRQDNDDGISIHDEIIAMFCERTYNNNTPFEVTDPASYPPALGQAGHETLGYLTLMRLYLQYGEILNGEEPVLLNDGTERYYNPVPHNVTWNNSFDTWENAVLEQKGVYYDKSLDDNFEGLTIYEILEYYFANHIEPEVAKDLQFVTTVIAYLFCQPESPNTIPINNDFGDADDNFEEATRQLLTRTSDIKGVFPGILGGYSDEYDSNYMNLAIRSLILLADFADDNMKNKAEMALELLLLDRIMDFSANHHGGAAGGREYRTYINSARFKNSCYYSLFGVGPKDNVENAGDYFVSDYCNNRLPEYITELSQYANNLDVAGDLNRKENYWHLHKEFNYIATGLKGKWTFVTPYYNLGGMNANNQDWKLNILSVDEYPTSDNFLPNAPFRIWWDMYADVVNYKEEGILVKVPTHPCTGAIFHYRYALMQTHILASTTLYLHILQSNPFSIYWNENTGAQSEVDFRESNANLKIENELDKNIWHIFVEDNDDEIPGVAFALKFGEHAQVMEIARIGSGDDYCYNSWEEFRDAILDNANYKDENLEDGRYKYGADIYKNANGNWCFQTSHDDVIEATDHWGSINGNPIWDEFYDNRNFKRIETEYGYGEASVNEKLITYNDNLKTMTLSLPDGNQYIYNFDTWTKTHEVTPPHEIILPTKIKPSQKKIEIHGIENGAPINQEITIDILNGQGDEEWEVTQDHDWYTLSKLQGLSGETITINFPTDIELNTYKSKIKLSLIGANKKEEISIQYTLHPSVFYPHKETTTYINHLDKWATHWTANKLYVGEDNEWEQIFRSLIKFDISDLDANAIINNATLSLTAISVEPDANESQTINLHQVLKPWEDPTVVNWNQNASGSNWNGCEPDDNNASSTPVVSLSSNGGENIQYDFSSDALTNLVRLWHLGLVENDGLLIKLEDENSGYRFKFNSVLEEEGQIQNKTLCPQLSISYTISDDPYILTNRSEINVTAKVNGPSPQSEPIVVEIRNTEDTWTATKGEGDWFSLSQTTGESGDIFDVVFNTSTLDTGEYSSSITIRPTNTSSSEAEKTVYINLIVSDTPTTVSGEYNVIEDTFLDYHPTNPMPAKTNYNDNKGLYVGKHDTWNVTRRILLRFDVSEITPGAIIENAKLILAYKDVYNDQDDAYRDLNIYQVLEPWDAGSVCWKYSETGGDEWGGCNPNGTYAASTAAASISRNTSTTEDLYVWEGPGLTEMVQHWIDNSSSNHGLLIKQADETALHMFKFYANHDDYTSNLWPKLEVSYTGINKKGKFNTVQLPKEFELKSNYPNPFNSRTTIQYALPKDRLVVIQIYDMVGNAVTTLVNEHKTAGFHQVLWNGENKHGNQVGSGIYLLKLVAGEYHDTYKMILMK